MRGVPNRDRTDFGNGAARRRGRGPRQLQYGGPEFVEMLFSKHFRIGRVRRDPRTSEVALNWSWPGAGPDSCSRGAILHDLEICQCELGMFGRAQTHSFVSDALHCSSSYAGIGGDFGRNVQSESNCLASVAVSNVLLLAFALQQARSPNVIFVPQDALERILASEYPPAAGTSPHRPTSNL